MRQSFCLSKKMAEKEIKPSVLHANGCNYLLIPISWEISYYFKEACVAWETHWCHSNCWGAPTRGLCVCTAPTQVFQCPFTADYITEPYKGPASWTAWVLLGKAQKQKPPYKSNFLKNRTSLKTVQPNQ